MRKKRNMVLSEFGHLLLHQPASPVLQHCLFPGTCLARILWWGLAVPWAVAGIVTAVNNDK